MYTDILKSIPFLSPLSEKELSDLGKIIEKRQFHKNQVLLWEKDTQNYMYIVYSGKAKVVHLSIDGKEQILAIHRAGDFFGEMALLDGKTAPATVIALEESEIGLITKESFDRYIMKNDRVMKEISSLLCSRLREAWLRLKVLSFADAEHRVRAVLKLISINNSVRNQDGTLISFKLNHEDIANYASVSRETVTRLIGRFSKDTEIEVLENKHILLKPSFFDKTLFV